VLDFHIVSEKLTALKMHFRPFIFQFVKTNSPCDVKIFSFYNFVFHRRRLSGAGDGSATIATVMMMLQC
jgi:hypothetical protein